MTVRISKPEFNLREKISELDKPTGLKGSELMRSDTTQDARTFMSSDRKNLLINGQFDIWQRGTDSGSKTSTGYFSSDRWKSNDSGGTYRITRQAFTNGQTEVPDNPKYYLRFAVTTGANNIAFGQRIEGVENVQGEVTLSFWAKGTNPPSGYFDKIDRQDFGSGGSVSSVVDTGYGSFKVSSHWQKFVFTFKPPSIKGKTLGTTHSGFYECQIFRQPAADNGTGAYTIDIANVQLEVGKNATEFDKRPIGQELALCQRYFYSIYRRGSSNDGNLSIGGVGSLYTNSAVYIDILLPTEMRATPSLIVPSGTNRFQVCPTTCITFGNPTMIHAHTNCITLTSTLTSSNTAGRVGNVFMATAAWSEGDQLAFSAEL